MVGTLNIRSIMFNPTNANEKNTPLFITANPHNFTGF